MELGKNKPATLLMVAVLAVSSLIAVKSLPSLAISKPSVPEILDISFSAHPYDVPPVTSIDPYTGKNITTQAGHRVENKTIDFTVKNQPFTPYTNAQGNYIGLYYQVSHKGHYEESWSTPGKPFAASSGDFTILAIPSGVLSGPPEGKMDFRVRAGIGYVTSWQYFMDTYVYELNGEKSDWSSTKTIAIGEILPTTDAPTAPAPQSTPTQTATVTPTQNPPTTSNQPVTQSGAVFGLDWKEIAIVVLAVLVVGSWVAIVVLWRKRSAK